VGSTRLVILEQPIRIGAHRVAERAIVHASDQQLAFSTSDSFSLCNVHLRGSMLENMLLILTTYLLPSLPTKTNKKIRYNGIYAGTKNPRGHQKKRRAPAIQRREVPSSIDRRADRRSAGLARQIRLEETPPSKKNMIKRDRKERKRHSLTHDRLHLGQIREHTRPFKMH
jgi:hypothetical protein